MGETAVMITEMVIVGIIFLTLFAVLGLILVYVERKICAFFQQRLGPMRVGFWGTAQTLADVIKLLFKEPLITKNADKFLFNLSSFYYYLLHLWQLQPFLLQKDYMPLILILVYFILPLFHPLEWWVFYWPDGQVK